MREGIASAESGGLELPLAGRGASVHDRCNYTEKQLQVLFIDSLRTQEFSRFLQHLRWERLPRSGQRIGHRAVRQQFLTPDVC